MTLNDLKWSFCVKIWSDLGIQWAGVLAFGENCSEICNSRRETTTAHGRTRTRRPTFASTTKPHVYVATTTLPVVSDQHRTHPPIIVENRHRLWRKCLLVCYVRNLALGIDIRKSVAPWNFYTRLEIGQGNIAHTPTGRGSPNNINRENLKVGLKFSVCTSISSGLMGISSQFFYPDDVPRARGDNVGTIFGWPAPKIWEGEKNVENPARFLTTFDFDREYLRNGSTNRKSKK